MLNDFVELFLGAYYNFISDDYELREYFASVLTVGVLLLLLAAVLGVVLLTVHHTYIAARKGIK